MISARELARLIGPMLRRQPELCGGEPFTGIAVDSRLVEPGNLFVALRGERTDGHRFAAEAAANGAAALLLSDSTRDPRDPNVAAFVVDDTLAALQRAGSEWRRERGATVIGITGSVGKTTTREAAAQVLARAGAVLQSPANYNGDIGLPIALLGIEPRHRWAVIEIGPYSEDEMRRLCGMAGAEVGIVTNVGPTHLERFGTLDDTERIKGMLPASLPARGLAVLNADDERAARMAERSAAAPLLYGTGEAAQLRAADVRARGFEGISLRLELRAGSGLEAEPFAREARSPLAGAHHAATMLTAAAVGLHAGMAVDDVIAALAELEPGSRMRRVEAAGGFTIIDDAYNAAPRSMEAALELLASSGGRRVAVLGDMLELGTEEESAHEALGAFAASRCDWLLCMGPRSRRTAEAAQRAGLRRTCWAETARQASDLLRDNVRAGDAVLIKASHATGLHEIVPRVETLAPLGAETDRPDPADARDGWGGDAR